MDKITKLLFVSLLISIISVCSIGAVSAEDNRMMDIETIPDNYFFQLSNLKPGDWAKRKITVQNRGEKDFSYNTETRFKRGSKKLYNEFLIKVWDSSGVLHIGKLKDFNGLSPRLLKSMNQEDLMFQVEFPYELGNEFQGLGFEFELRFTIEDYTSNPPPETPSNPGNPDNPENPVSNPEEPDNPENLEPEDPVVPDNPTNEDNPETNKPENPSDPQEPDESVLNPPHPIDPDTLNSPPTDGQILPATSTNIFNFILGGAVLLLAGASILYLSRKRNLDMKV